MACLGRLILLCLLIPCLLLRGASGACSPCLVETRVIRVALHQNLAASGYLLNGFLNQINVDQEYNFYAQWVQDANFPSDISTQYDVVVLASSGNGEDNNAISTATATAIRNFVLNGGGLVTSAWLAVGISNSNIVDILQDVVPVILNGQDGSCAVTADYTTRPQILVTNTTHPVGSRVAASFPFNSFAGFSTGGNIAAAQSIGTLTGTKCTGLTPELAKQGLMVANPGAGRSVYLSMPFCGTFFHNVENLRVGPTDVLLESALFWAAAVPPLCADPCQNGGICTGPNTCNCGGTGYSGATCENAACNPVCQNGFCAEPDVCQCNAGWEGGACETPICSQGCSSAGGTCIAPDNCDCNAGYSGPACDTVDCNGVFCQNGGECSAVPQTCECAGTGFNGTLCENPVCPSGCNGGTCLGGDVCDCSATQFGGPHCTDPKCEPSCTNGGTCISFNNCDCTGTGYIGAQCQEADCQPDCQHGGVCFNPSQPCSCFGTGYIGNSCETPYCGQCFHNGTCVAPQTCDCEGTGFYGQYCEALIIVTTGTTGTTGASSSAATTGTTGTTGSATTGVTTQASTTTLSLSGTRFLPQNSAEEELYENVLLLAGGGGIVFCCICCVGGILVAKCQSAPKQKGPRRAVPMARMPMAYYSSGYDSATDEGEVTVHPH